VVGFEKVRGLQKNLSTLEVADLMNRRVSGGRLSGRELPLLVEVDLSWNLVSSWRVVHGMISDLPRLAVLQLNHNRLSFDEDEHGEDLPRFKAKSLALTSCALDWDKLLRIGKMFPDLVELRCVKNFVSPRTCPDVGSVIFERLEELDVSENPFDSPEALRVFGRLSNLRVLRAESVGLTALKVEEGDFPRLFNLNLRGNVLASLASVDELRKVTWI
jgi:Leucine-rich repeat (LRR) protein